MKINFNRKNIVKALAFGSAFILMVYGGIEAIKFLNKKTDDKKAILLELNNKPIVSELYYNGVYYNTPDSKYSLKVINNHVYGVREYYIKHELEEFIDENGVVKYVKSPEDIEIDGVGYRYIRELKEPIIVRDFEVETTDSYSM